jgi:hypothetical protein
VSPEEAVERLNVVLDHAWMVRTYLKHAEEGQEDEELLDVLRDGGAVAGRVRAGDREDTGGAKGATGPTVLTQ